MTIKEMIIKLLEFDMNKKITVANDSQRIEINSTDIKEENNKIIIQM